MRQSVPWQWLKINWPNLSISNSWPQSAILNKVAKFTNLEELALNAMCHDGSIQNALSKNSSAKLKSISWGHAVHRISHSTCFSRNVFSFNFGMVKQLGSEQWNWIRRFRRFEKFNSAWYEEWQDQISTKRFVQQEHLLGGGWFARKWDRNLAKSNFTHCKNLRELRICKAAFQSHAPARRLLINVY